MMMRLRCAICGALLCIASALVAGALHARPFRVTTEQIYQASDLTDSPSGLELVRVLIDSGAARQDSRLFNRALDLLTPLLLEREAPAEAWYLAGKARYELATLGAVTRTREYRLIGMSYAQRAAVALREALKRDPGYADAAALLANDRLRTLAGITNDNDAGAIRRAAPLETTNADALLARARLELNWDQPDSAMAAATRMVAVGGDSALALLEIARARFMAGQLTSGQDAWFDGLAKARSAAAKREFRQDIAWVATDAELEAFDSLAPQGRSAWAHRFWERRAVAGFHSLGERLAEHERRIRFALAEFPLRTHERDFNKAMPYRSGQARVDDRGVIYIRHGAPSRIFRSGAESVQGCPVYSWLYDQGADRGMTVNFRPFFTLLISDKRFCAYADFKLIPGGVWLDSNAVKLAEYDSSYARWVNERRPLHRARLGRTLVANSLDNLTLAATTDAYPLQFTRSLGAVVRVYGLAHPGQLLVALGVPPGSIEKITLANRPAYPLRLRLTALPGGDGPPVTFDTTLVYDAARSLKPNEWIAGYVDLPVAPGEYEIRWLLTGADPAAGSSGLQVGVDVPGIRPGKPTVSAVLLGTAGTELRWPSGAGRFPLSASNTYRVGSDVEVLLEAAELPPDADVDVRIRLEPAEGTKGGKVEARFTARATGPNLVLRQALSLSQVKPGYYRLTVEIEDKGGHSVSRSQPLWVVM